MVEKHLYGTPLYMSPEQARREHADARSDVFCLGGTLLHALTGRLPLWRDEPERFWECKRRGDVDAPTPEESAGILAVAGLLARERLLERGSWHVVERWTAAGRPRGSLGGPDPLGLGPAAARSHTAASASRASGSPIPPSPTWW